MKTMEEKSWRVEVPFYLKQYGIEDFYMVRSDFAMPMPLDESKFSDEQMEELALRVRLELTKYHFDTQSKYLQDDVDDAYWKELELQAVDMGMEYIEDDDRITKIKEMMGDAVKIRLTHNIVEVESEYDQDGEEIVSTIDEVHLNGSNEVLLTSEYTDEPYYADQVTDAVLDDVIWSMTQGFEVIEKKNKKNLTKVW